MNHRRYNHPPDEIFARAELGESMSTTVRKINHRTTRSNWNQALLAALSLLPANSIIFA
jgi:hypothetical protein